MLGAVVAAGETEKLLKVRFIELRLGLVYSSSRMRPRVHDRFMEELLLLVDLHDKMSDLANVDILQRHFRTDNLRHALRQRAP